MKNYLKLFITIIITINCSTFAVAQKIDFTALDAYWKMIEPLKKGDSLSSATWNTFLNIKANKTYVDNQAFDKKYLERLRKTIEYVYMPKHEALLKKRLIEMTKDTASFWMTFKVHVYKEYEKELKSYQQELSTPEYLNTAYKNTFEWLPKRLQIKNPNVNIYYIGIENDAIAGNGTVVSSLWNPYVQEKLKNGIVIGHEMHHILRNGFNYKNISENEEGIMYALTVILNEGSADMIDKKYAIIKDKELPMGSRFKDFLLFQADSVVAQLDKNIIEMTQSKGKNFKTVRDYRDLCKWSSGHLPGFYMADMIVRNGYKKQLINNIQNPFFFIYLYNKAAKKDRKKPTIFSESAINYIKQLEHKYWIKNRNISEIAHVEL